MLLEGHKVLIAMQAQLAALAAANHNPAGLPPMTVQC